LEAFLRTSAPRTRLTYDNHSRRGTLMPDQALRQLARDSEYAGDLVNVLAADAEGIAFTFESGVAFEEPGIEFINNLHPLVSLALDKYDETLRARKSAQQLSLRTKLLTPGEYVFFVYRLKVRGARARNFLETLILDGQLALACSAETAEAALGEMVERGADIATSGTMMNADTAQRAVAAAESAFLARVEALRRGLEEENAAFVELRLASVRNFFGRQIDRRRVTLERLQRENRPRTVLRLWEGQIARLETEMHARVTELERQRTVQVEWDEVTAGLLQVTPASN
jgi:hypothetical protein